jgi:uncharacterized protein
VTDTTRLYPNAWITTSRGGKFYPLEPDIEDIDIRDIAHALAVIPRYTGHTREPFYVAQHSVMVSRLVPIEDALWGLLHDASEAYLMDLPSPIKRWVEMAPYRNAEERLMGAICERFGLTSEEPESVKEADRRMLVTESRQLFRRRHPDWHDCAEPYRIAILPWSYVTARLIFLRRFRELTRLSARCKVVGEGPIS